VIDRQGRSASWFGNPGPGFDSAEHGGAGRTVREAMGADRLRDGYVFRAPAGVG